MAFLLAAFGPRPASDWARSVRDLGDVGSGGARLSDWHDEAATVRVGVLDPTGTLVGPVRAARATVVAAVGRVEGGGEDGGAAVLEAYGRAGAAGLASLRGEYAYALWDGGERSLFVGCDAVGLQAPAYTWNGRTFVLSTRAVVLLGRPDVPRAFDPVYLAHALGGLWARTASATAFEGVRRMVGGELIRVSARGLERLEGARLKFRASPVRGRDEAVRELAEALDGAVAEEARTGTSCVALSGGVDSCVVATALAKRQPELHAVSIVSPDGSPGDEPTLAPLTAAFPGMHHHRILLTGDTDSLQPGPLSDDPVCAGPILQSGRAALLRAARDLGFRRVFNGEGGDEIFDMAWRPGDLIRQVAVGRVFSALGSRLLARRILRDFIAGGRGPVSALLRERARKRVRARRPWLRASFWESPSLASAWQEAVSFGRGRSARERLPEILGAHGRYWRTQELVRLSSGVEGSSPLLRQSIVELAGSFSAEAAIDLRHGKVVLRRLAAQRVPAALAWRPKNEPLSDWLITRWVANETHARRLVSQIKDSRFLSHLVDTATLVQSIDAARDLPEGHWLASSIVELAAVVEWVTTVEARWGL
jgi:asparagine synthase (glutamine-hydrolysing)